MLKDALRFMFRPGMANPVGEFENRFASFIGVKHAVATGSGTDAMLQILDGFNLSPGDHVLSAAYTIRPLVEVLSAKGYDLELVDIDSDDFNLSVKDLKRRLRPDTKAVIVTHMFGAPACMDEIHKAVKGSQCIVIEDAAHAHGATYKGRKCGSLAHAAFFSFDQIKPLSTFGGGMAVTDDDALAAQMHTALDNHPPVRHRFSKVVMGYAEHLLFNSPLFSLLCWLTENPKARTVLGGLYRALDRRPPKRNIRLSDMQAVLGINQLDHLKHRLERRQENAEKINEHLSTLVPQKIGDDCTSTYYKHTVMAPADSADIKRRLMAAGIDVGIKDDINFPCYRLLGHGDVDFPGTHKVYEHLVEVPAHELLSPRELRRIIDALGEVQ
jgi:dTDP-4-amino-4,6-dideoxygalactose transaminase